MFQRMTVKDDDWFHSESEEDLSMAQKDWDKMHQRSLTQGYREGVSQGAEQGLQAAFDRAYQEGFRQGRECGRVRGRIAARKFMNSDKPEVLEILNTLEQELNSLERRRNSVTMTEIEKINLKLSSVLQV